MSREATRAVASRRGDAPRSVVSALTTAEKCGWTFPGAPNATGDFMTSRTLLSGAASVLVLVLAGCGGSSSYSSPPSTDTGNPTPTPVPSQHTVQVGPGMTFSPATLTIKPGDTVTWTWRESGHSVTSGTDGNADGNFCSPSDGNCSSATLSSAGATYSHTFTTAGSFPYFCVVHFSMGMTGVIDVVP